MDKNTALVVIDIQNDITKHSLTILFEEPFWIGLFEIIEGNQMQVCKVTFGAEPTDQELMEFIDKRWNQPIFILVQGYFRI